MQRAELIVGARAPSGRPLQLERAGGSIALAVLALAVVVGTATVFNLEVTGPVAVTLVPVAALVAHRHPVAAVLALFGLMGFAGTLVAFTPFQPRPAADLLLLALWIGVLLGFISNRERRVWLWPALLLPVLYIVLTLVQGLLTEPLSRGLDSLRLSTWTMTGMLLVALAPWGQDSRRQMIRGVLLVGLLVGAYGIFRWATGPSPEEAALARTTVQGTRGEPRFYGSMRTAQDLALWCLVLVPFALGVALGWRGRWRLAAIAVVGACGFLVVATEVRAGSAAVVGGICLTLLLYQLATAFPGGTRLTTTLAGGAVIAALGISVFAIALGNSGDDRIERFERILTPGNDPSFTNRLDRWADAWPLIESEPLGHGLATVGSLEMTGEFLPQTTPHLDSSYVKIAFEQGLPVMVFFVFAMVAVLVTLALRAIATPDRERAAIAIGACGTLLALLIFFFSGNHIEKLSALLGWILVGLGISQFSSLNPASVPTRRHTPDSSHARQPTPADPAA